MSRWIPWSVAGLLAIVPVAAGAWAAAPSESMPERAEIKAIRAELERGLAGLRLPEAPRPYRAEVRTVRAELLSIDGSYGGLITDLLERQSIGMVDVRVGSRERDNSNFFGGDGGIARLDVSEELSPDLTRKRVWLGLDRAFRGATQAYAAKKVALQRLAAEDLPPDDAGPAKAVTERHVEVFEPLDRAGLATLVESLSGRFADWPTIDNGDVHVQVLRSHETVVSSEGIVLEWARDRAILAVVADTKAVDGMQLDHGLAIHFQIAPTANEDLRRAGEAMVDRVLGELDEMAKAPLIDEEYDGPLLFRAVAAAQLLASTVATEVVGTPAPLGEGGRMMELEPAWHKRYGKVVMPPFIDLVDDPTQNGFGQFEIDAEGFRPERLQIVEGGVLRNLLMTRTPNGVMKGSNGRARITPSLEVAPAISNLTLESRRRAQSDYALERELLARAREDGYEFAYIVESLRDGTVLGPVPRESASGYAGTGKLDLPVPARIYKIEAGGKKTLVRGALLAPVSMRVLRRIRAVGQTTEGLPMRIPVGGYGGFNADVGIDGVLSQTVDVEVRSPALLIDGLELLAERGEYERLPTLIHPLRRGPTTSVVAPAR